MSEYKIINGTSYNINTPDKVIEILERARKDGIRVRLFYGNFRTGEDWAEICDTIGTIGRSCGSRKVPLLILTSRSLGGGIISTDYIVKITIDKEIVYEHPLYHLPELSIRKTSSREYPYTVYQKDTAHYKCETRGEAERVIEFYKGNRNRI